jgi:MFS family permease
MERNVPSSESSGPPVAFPSWRHLNGYHCYVFALAALGWMFDAMDQQIFTNSRSITLTELLPHATEARINQVGGYVTSAFIAGWACGGLLFGVLGDKWGRVKTMAVTILIYAGFTGLSAWSPDWEIFGLCRFLTGLGVGGEFAVGAALVAEVMPAAVRAHALGLMQALAAVGTILAAWMLGAVVPHWGWEGLYYLGALAGVGGGARVREPARAGKVGGGEGGGPSRRQRHQQSFRRAERTFHRCTLAAPDAGRGRAGFVRHHRSVGRGLLESGVDRHGDSDPGNRDAPEGHRVVAGRAGRAGGGRESIAAGRGRTGGAVA